MACPHTAGLAALVKSRFPAFTAAQIRQQIEKTADDKGGGRWLLKHELTVEIDGSEKPALIAEWLGMQMVSP
jgi:subtilisin family serine protease